MNFIACKDCPAPARTKGLCPTHYARSRSGGSERARDVSEVQPCAVSHCNREAQSRSYGAYCDPHYQLNYRGIDPETKILRENASGRKIYDSKCAVAECPYRASIKGACRGHYKKIVQERIPCPEGLNIELWPFCVFDGCVNRTESLKRGLCHSHNCQYMEGRPLTPLRDSGVYVTGELKCSIKNCLKPAATARMCLGHSSRASKYGLTVYELESLLDIAVCANPGCETTGPLHIDHDHETGKVRGMLCVSCNTSLGRLGESVDRILGLAEYKRLHS